MTIDITKTQVWDFLRNVETTDISRNEMKTILENVNNPDMVSFVSIVPEDMKKYSDYWIVDENGKKRKNPNPTPNPYESGIFKLTRKFKIVTGFDYENSIRTRLEKEGKNPDDFVGGYKPTIDENTGEVKQREVWFDMISKGLVTDKKTHSKFYFRYQYKDGESTIGTPEYFYNGETIDKMLFDSFLVQKDYDNQYSNQGLDDFLPFQVCNLDHILYMSIGGTHYRLVD